MLAIDRAMPKALLRDNGLELVSKALAEWVSETERIFISPEQPWRNRFVESFNGKILDEFLGANHSCSLDYARVIIGL